MKEVSRRMMSTRAAEKHFENPLPEEGLSGEALNAKKERLRVLCEKLSRQVVAETVELSIMANQQMTDFSVSPKGRRELSQDLEVIVQMLKLDDTQSKYNGTKQEIAEQDIQPEM